MIEYAIIVALISGGLVLTARSVGSNLGATMSNVASGLAGDQKTAPPQSAPQSMSH